MTVQRVIMTVADVRQRLPKLYEHLSRADSERLDAILPLFRSAGETRANLAPHAWTLSRPVKTDKNSRPICDSSASM